LVFALRDLCELESSRGNRDKAIALGRRAIRICKEQSFETEQAEIETLLNSLGSGAHKS
jgi:hypothetical protein